MRRVPSWLAVAVVMVVAACGDSAPSGTGTGTCTPGTAASFGITAAGVSPKAVCVLPAGTVTFTNNDSVAHDIESDLGCAPLNLGLIAAGASKAATFTVVEVCAFHDAGAPANAAFKGTVAVTNATVGGGGY